MCGAAPGQSGTAASASLEIVDACGPRAKGALPRYTQLYPATNLPSIFPAVPHAFALSLLRHTPRRRARIPRRRRVQPASGLLGRARPYRRLARPRRSWRISLRPGRLRFCAVPLTLRRVLMFLCHIAPLLHWMLVSNAMLPATNRREKRANLSPTRKKRPCGISPQGLNVHLQIRSTALTG